MLPPSVDPIGMGSEGWHPSMEFILEAKLVELLPVADIKMLLCYQLAVAALCVVAGCDWN